ncbi:MAG: VOC family protein [bacterium]|nr:VOC family protein [bacterium]
MKNKISTCLWYDGKAQEAASFYVSLFKYARVLSSNPMTTIFELDGHQYVALNGGPMYKFTEAVSLMVNCETQDEIDRFWSKLCDGGSEGQCGWLKDKYGLSWQVIPSVLGSLLTDPDREKSGRALQAMLQMKKLDIAALQRAFEGK